MGTWKIRRRTWKRPSGQALVMACLMVLVLALAVLTTVTFGHTVHERIRLQNTADAAAYSSAAMEARAFNFYAFANRAQASHYVSAMVWQSLDSFVYFVEAFLTDSFAVMQTLVPCLTEGGPVCQLLQATPGVGEFLSTMEVIGSLLRAFVGGFQQALEASNLDARIGRDIVPLHRTLNGALAEASTAVMLASLAEVATTSQRILQANDPNLDSSVSHLTTGPLNACLFDRTHFREANGSPLQPNLEPFKALRPSEIRDGSKVARAKRAMAVVANATRFACDGEDERCPKGFVTSRRTADAMKLPAGLEVLRDLFQLDQNKWGQTRMLSFGSYDPQAAVHDRPHPKSKPGDHADPGPNPIRSWKNSPNAPTAHLGQGDVLGSDDVYALRLGPGGVFTFPGCGASGSPADCPGDPRRAFGEGTASTAKSHSPTYMFETSIWAMSDEDARRIGVPEGGIHWRLVRPGNASHPELAELGLNERQWAGFTLYSANVRPVADGNHRWEGIVPFPHFEPGQFAESCGSDGGRGGDASTAEASRRSAVRGDEFNQPSSWILLNKPPEQLRNPVPDSSATRAGPALLNRDGVLSFRMVDGVTVELENERPVELLWTAGLHALSRGQAYYHRPGDWAEHPNFFNPYWRPRLASVYQGRGSFPLLTELIESLPPPFDRRPQKLITH